MTLLRSKIGLLLACLCGTVDAKDSTVEITIDVYDYSGIKSDALLNAQDAAGEILRRAGIDAKWRTCLEPARPASCDSGVDDVTHLVVKILPEPMFRKITTSRDQLGMSVTGRPGGFALDAYVCLERVMNQATLAKTSWTPLLGATITHEVGHLLLGDNSHFGNGIMRGPWGLREIKEIGVRGLDFAPQQAEKMRAEVRRRVLNRTARFLR